MSLSSCYLDYSHHVARLRRRRHAYTPASNTASHNQLMGFLLLPICVGGSNRPFAAKPSRDLLFIKLWAATLRMPEMEKACRKHQNGQV